MLTRRKLFALLLASPFARVPTPVSTRPQLTINKIPMPAVFDTATGISMRFIRQYDIAIDQHPQKLDVEMIRASTIEGAP